jgi:hypothetical protein
MNPTVTVTASTYYQITYLDVAYAENAWTFDVSIHNYLNFNGNIPLWPDNSNWGVSGNAALSDPLWSRSLYDEISEYVQLPFQGVATEVYWTESWTL